VPSARCDAARCMLQGVGLHESPRTLCVASRGCMRRSAWLRCCTHPRARRCRCACIRGTVHPALVHPQPPPPCPPACTRSAWSLFPSQRLVAQHFTPRNTQHAPSQRATDDTPHATCNPQRIVACNTLCCVLHELSRAAWCLRHAAHAATVTPTAQRIMLRVAIGEAYCRIKPAQRHCENVRYCAARSFVCLQMRCWAPTPAGCRSSPCRRSRPPLPRVLRVPSRARA
jgi:hypothetical protein